MLRGLGLSLFAGSVLLAAGCGAPDAGLKAPPPAAAGQLSAPAADAAPGGPLPLPAPSAVQARLRGGKAASSVLTRDAADFVAGLSQRAVADGTEAIFTPDWTNGASPFATVAYAIYRFDLRARTGKFTLHTQWSHAPGEMTRLWLGVSNWRRDRWDWYSGAPAGNVALPVDGPEPYADADTGELYVAVAVLGQQSSMLKRVWLDGFSRRGDWWMYGRDAGHAARSRFKGPDSPNVLWRVDLGQPVQAPVYAADGTLYACRQPQGSREAYLDAIKPDGTRDWTYTLERNPDGPGVLDAGPHTPAVDDDGTIYCAFDYGPLVALFPDGTEKWRYTGHWACQSPVAIGLEGNIYVPALDYTDHTNPYSGYEMAHYLLAVGRDGKLLWEHSFSPNEYLQAVAVAPTGMVYVTDRNGRLFALAPDGSEKWRFTPDFTDLSMPAIAPDGGIYVAANHYFHREAELFALTPDGAVAWSCGLPERSVQSAPVIGADGAAYINCADGRLYVVEPGGALRWSYPVGGGGNAIAGPGGMPALDGAGNVYAGSQDARIYALRADGTLKWWLATPQPVGASVCLGEDGTLFAVSGAELLAIGPGSTLGEHSASGYVRDAGGAGIAAVTISITGEEPVLTDAQGYWEKHGLVDGAYLVSPTKDNLVFTPLFAELQITGADAVVADFTAAPRAQPQWPGYGYDPQHTGRCPYTGPADSTIRWQVPVFGTIAQPAIAADGTVYALTSLGNVLAINPDSSEQWRLYLGSSYSNAQPTTPAVGSDGTVYVNTNVLTAITPGGAYKWSYVAFDLGYSNRSSGSPVVDAAGRIVLCIGGWGFCALNPDASLAWSWLIDGDYNAYCTPSLGGGGMVFGSDDSRIAVALDAQQNLKWVFEAPPDKEAKGVPPRAVVVGGSGECYFALGRRLYAVHPDGSVRWEYHAPGTIGQPALGADGSLYFGLTGGEVADMKFIALDNNGALRWEYYADGYYFSQQPVIDAAGTVYAVRDADGILYAFNPDGTLKWSYRTYHDISSPALSADGTLYFGSFGYLYAMGG